MSQRPLDRLIFLTTAFLLLALAGCGVSASARAISTLARAPARTLPRTPSPAPASTASIIPASPASPEPATPVAPRPTPAQQPSSAAPAGGCPDPYAGGAPYTPAPGEPIRLRPTGTPPPMPRYDPEPFTPDSALEAVIRGALGQDIDHYGVVVKRLDDDDGAAINGGSVFYAASLYKIWVMLEAFDQQNEGLLSFDEQYVVSDYYAGQSLNPGELPLCSTVTAEQAIQAMMNVSDNVAANMMLERVGTTNTNNMLRQLGLAVSGLTSSGDVYTTANGTEILLEMIARHYAVNPNASESMLDLLASETIDDRLPALLPSDTRVAHKTGSWSTATNDAGIVYSPNATYVIVVLSDFGYGDNAGPEIAGLSRAVYDYFNPG